MVELVDAGRGELPGLPQRHHGLAGRHVDRGQRMIDDDAQALSRQALDAAHWVAVVDSERHIVAAGRGEVEVGRGGRVVVEPRVAARRGRDGPGVRQGLGETVVEAVVGDGGGEPDAGAGHIAAARGDADDRGVVVGLDDGAGVAKGRLVAVGIHSRHAEGIAPPAAGHGGIASRVGRRRETEFTWEHGNPLPVRGFVLAVDNIVYRPGGPCPGQRRRFGGHAPVLGECATSPLD